MWLRFLQKFDHFVQGRQKVCEKGGLYCGPATNHFEIILEVLKEKYPGLTHNRVPVCNSAAPLEADFDTISNCLLETNVNCPVIVNCQVLFLVFWLFGIRRHSFKASLNKPVLKRRSYATFKTGLFKEKLKEWKRQGNERIPHFC